MMMPGTKADRVRQTHRQKARTKKYSDTETNRVVDEKMER